MTTLESLRVDKWLWAVRLYKSRSLATQACQAGHVQINHQPLKPAREIRVADVLTARTGTVVRTVKVLGLIERRVGAKRVPEFMEDLTPEEEYERARQQSKQEGLVFPKGFGRPSKKQRRDINKLFLRD